MKTVRNLGHLIDAFGGNAEFGEAIWPDAPDRKQRTDRASTAKWRGCIPVVRWAATIRHAQGRGILVTREQLAAWSEKQAGKQKR